MTLDQYTHYTNVSGNDCYTPNFLSSISRITIWNKNQNEITVETINGELTYHNYSEFESLLNQYYEERFTTMEQLTSHIDM